MNIPLHEWKSIFTTNYDELLEHSFAEAGQSLEVITSNFDFNVTTTASATKLFKLHGTIGKDVSDGNNSRIILTLGDYDQTTEYREALFQRLQGEMLDAQRVLIIGYSLSDPHIHEIVEEVIAIKKRIYRDNQITLLLYSKDENRAQLLGMRGIQVAFGSLDDFVRELSTKEPKRVVPSLSTHDPLVQIPELRPITTVIEDEISAIRSSAVKIFNGWPAQYSDIIDGLTFSRDDATRVSLQLSDTDRAVAILLGASGVGKTTMAREAVLSLRAKGFIVWEHKRDQPFDTSAWIKTLEWLEINDKQGALFVDDSHLHLINLDALIDRIATSPTKNLKLILASAKNQWGPRVKTPSLYSVGREFHISRLSNNEIDRLISLVEGKEEIRKLVEDGFSGFSAHEKQRRLRQRCEADMFVCMRNIFASDKYDDIILREYGELIPSAQDVYKYVAAMETSGVRVHRQLVMRILSISAASVQSILESLTDIINEHAVNAKEGIYAWRVRHPVIANIVSSYKFNEKEKIIELFNRVLDNISPTYDIEIRTIRELCAFDSGISIIPEKVTQNILLRRMMSIAPGERVPRHRLIRNLIDCGEFEQAETEIRIYETDFGKEAPIVRYRILLMIARAQNSPGLMPEDRTTILDKATELASAAVTKFSDHKYILQAYAELGVAVIRQNGEYEVFDDAIAKLKRAEQRIEDPEITKIINKYQRMISSAGAS